MRSYVRALLHLVHFALLLSISAFPGRCRLFIRSKDLPKRLLHLGTVRYDFRQLMSATQAPDEVLVRSLREALAMEPENEAAMYNLGLMLISSQHSSYNLQLEALVLFERVIKLNPGREGAWWNIANIREGMNDIDGACKAYDTVIELTKDPNLAAASYNNKIRILIQADRLDEAARASNAAVNALPTCAGAWSNMGVVLHTNGNVDWATTCFEKALSLDEGNMVAITNLAAMKVAAGESGVAINLYQRALALHPDDVSYLYALALLLKEVGDWEQSRQLFERCLQLDAEGPYASQIPFQLTILEAAASGSTSANLSMSAPPRKYVSDLFDFYSQGYESHMLDMLQYRGHELLFEAFRSIELSKGPLRALELGVGSGLVGSKFREQGYTGSLEGCDLSPAMVALAQQLFTVDTTASNRKVAIYQSVEVADAIDFLSSRANGQFDLVLAADTLCYFGALESILAKSKSVLKSGGYFIFTLEDNNVDYPPYRLLESGRVAHSREYIHRAAQECGLVMRSCTSAVIRKEGNRSAHGLIIILEVP